MSLKKRIEKLENIVSQIQKNKTGFLHKFVPALFYCGWLPKKTMKEKKVKFDVESCNPYCCFNHLIGLPSIKYTDDHDNIVGESEPVPLWDYEKKMVEKYESTHYYAQNKCRGAGASEIITVRHMAYKYIITPVNGRKCLVCAGINLDVSTILLHRIKELCDRIPFVYKIPPRSDYPEVIYFRRGMIKAIPAHPDAVRSYENVGDVIYEESAFWKLNEDEPVLKAGEPHVIKSSAHIGVLSTPNGQRGFFWTKIFNPDITTKYVKHVLNWREVVDVPVPVIDHEAVNRMRKDDPATYDQELDNKFLVSALAVWGEFKDEEEFEPEDYEAWLE